MTETPKPASPVQLFKAARQAGKSMIRTGGLTKAEQAGAEKLLKDLNITPIKERNDDATGSETTGSEASGS